MPTAGTVILNYVCPILGIVFTNWQNVAPLKDLDTAVKNGQGLNGLNPTPWVFMLGCTLAWTAYALLSEDYYLLLADFPGFMCSIWLNLGAIKLMYSDHHQKQTRKTLVHFLQKNDKQVSDLRKTLVQEKNEEMKELRKTLVLKQLDLSIDENFDEKDEEDAESGEEKKDAESGEDKSAPPKSGTTSTQLWIYAANQQNENDNDDDDDNDGDNSLEENGSKAPVRASDLSDGREKSVRFSSLFPRGISLASMKSLKNMKSLANLGTSFAKRKEKVNNWADVVWKITAQQQPAGAAHEKLLIGMIGLWSILFCVLMMYSFHDPRVDGRQIPLLVVGYFAVAVQLFFYGAPLARIGHVLKTKRCDCIHLQSLIGNFLNCLLWTGYGLAPQVMDPFIWAPCAVGCVFCAIQFFLCAVFPRTSVAEQEAKRFSITELLMPSTELGVDRTVSTIRGNPEISEALKGIREDESEEMSLRDLEKNESVREENENGFGESQYMTSFGHYSYLY